MPVARPPQLRYIKDTILYKFATTYELIAIDTNSSIIAITVGFSHSLIGTLFTVS